MVQHMISDEPMKVMIVDDHPIVREGLTIRLSLLPRLLVCGEAEGEDEAILKIEQQEPHLLIIDINLKQGHGIDLIKRVRAKFPQVKLLVFSGYDESLYAERALRAGAHGYINKGQSNDHLETAVSEVLAGKRYFSEELTLRVAGHSGDGTRRIRTGVYALSNRELQVFELIGGGRTSREIAAELHLSPHTVDTHRENIKHKLKLQSSADVSRFAIQWCMDAS
jgi:DNA-binding NarL/FixJ family response regulator